MVYKNERNTPYFHHFHHFNFKNPCMVPMYGLRGGHTPFQNHGVKT